MSFSSSVTSAVARLSSFFNGNAYNATTNAGGLAKGGNRVNFIPALQDVATVANAIAQEATAVDVALNNAVTASTAASSSAVNAQAASVAASTAAANAVAVSGLSALGADRRVIRASPPNDVFVYDTRLDPDGGLWRKRTKRASWGMEAASGTRSARSDFPQQAVLVIDGTGLYIFDADIQGAPLWMSFTLGGSGLGDFNAFNSASYESVSARAGWILIAGGSTALAIDLVSERIYRFAAAALYQYQGNIAARNAGRGFGAITATGIALTSVTADLELAYWPLAPQDPVSGLPMPHFLVATDLGISVVTPDLQIFNLTTVSAGFRRLTIDDRRSLVLANRTAISSCHVLPLLNMLYNGALLPLTRIGSSATIGAGGSNDLAALGSGIGASGSAAPSALGTDYFIAGGTGLGNTIGPAINLLAVDRIGSAASLITYITQRFNTGWLLGRPLFALAEANAGSLSAQNIISNGTFTSDLASWIAGTGWAWSSGTAAKTAGTASDLSQTLSTVAGLEYVVEYTLTRTAGTIQPKIDGARIDSTSSTGLSVGGTYRTQFRATAASHTLAFVADSSFAGSVDNVSVSVAIVDRSYRQNGYAVVGTLNRTAVAAGADLCALTGFTASNYLQQSYEDDFDTLAVGELCLKFWVQNASPSVAQAIFHRAAGSGAFLLAELNTSGQVVFTISDGSNSATATAALLPPTANSWTQVMCCRRGSQTEIWLNGVKVSTADAAAVGSLANASAISRIGVRTDGTNPATGLSVAQISLAPLAPLLDQALRMYEDESVLFTANAKALFGSTTATVFKGGYRDPITRSLYVVSDDGMAEFNGLLRAAYYRSTLARNKVRNSELRDGSASAPSVLPGGLSLGTAAGIACDVVGSTETSVDLRFYGTATAAEMTFNMDAGPAAANGQNWTSALMLQIVGGTVNNVNSIYTRLTERNSSNNPVGTTTSSPFVNLASSATQLLTNSRTNTNAATVTVRPQLVIAMATGQAIDITLRLSKNYLAQEATYSGHDYSLAGIDNHKAIGAAGGLVALGTTQGVELITPSLLMRDDLRQPFRLGYEPAGFIDVEGVTIDATPTVLAKVPLGWAAEHFSGVLTVTVSEDRNDGGERASYQRRFSVQRRARGNRTLGTSPIATTSGSTTVVVSDAGHGLIVGQRVALSGAATTNSIPAAEINTTVTVTAVTTNTWSFSATSSASSTGSGGGSAVVVGALSVVSSTLGTDIETTASMDVALSVDQTAGTLDVVATGVAAKRLAWSARLEVQRQRALLSGLN